MGDGDSLGDGDGDGDAMTGGNTGSGGVVVVQSGGSTGSGGGLISSGGSSSGGSSSGGSSSGGSSSGGAASGGAGSGGAGSGGSNPGSGGSEPGECPVTPFNAQPATTLGTTGAACLTANEIAQYGWNHYNCDGRTVTINGEALAPGNLNWPGSAPYIIEFTAGAHDYCAFAHW